jgi:hypothetical protein
LKKFAKIFQSSKTAIYFLCRINKEIFSTKMAKSAKPTPFAASRADGAERRFGGLRKIARLVKLGVPNSARKTSEKRGSSGRNVVRSVRPPSQNVAVEVCFIIVDSRSPQQAIFCQNAKKKVKIAILREIFSKIRAELRDLSKIYRLSKIGRVLQWRKKRSLTSTSPVRKF